MSTLPLSLGMSWFWAHSAGPSICDNLLLARLVDPELRREAERLSPAVFEATPKELVDRGILPGNLSEATAIFRRLS
jgi:hypothetical protein